MSLTGIDTNFTLPSRFYTSTEIFEEELERIFYSRWIYVACEADIPKPGDYVALKLGNAILFSAADAKVAKCGDFTMYAGTAAMNWLQERKATAGGSSVPTTTGLTTLTETCWLPAVWIPTFPKKILD